MLRKIKRFLRKIFRKSNVIPIKHPKEIEISAQGFSAAPDVLCRNTEKFRAK